MIIINKNADFSTCGLGQIKYNVTDDVKELLLSAYSGVTMDDLISFQTFIDAIGGLNGTIWNKLAHAYMYIFASNREEAEINLKTGRRVEFRPTDGGTNSLTCIHGEGVKLINGKCYWPYSESSRVSKPFMLTGRNLSSTTSNIIFPFWYPGTSYKSGGTVLYTTAVDNSHRVILSNKIIKTSIAVSFQSESDVTIVSNGVEVPNTNTIALPLSNNTAETKVMNVDRILNIGTEAQDFPYQFQFVGYNLTKAETIQIAAAADKMVL